MTHDERPYRRCVRVIITNNKRVLLGKKYINGRFAYYTVPGGGMELGDDIHSTVSKECLEEVGIRVKNIQSLGLQKRIDMELKKDNRAERFRGSEDNWYTAEYVRKDTSCHGEDNDSFSYTWESVESAIAKISTEKESTHTLSKIEALRRVERLLEDRCEGIAAW